eukprot:1432791-Prymnesium_polylepis.1
MHLESLLAALEIHQRRPRVPVDWHPSTHSFPPNLAACVHRCHTCVFVACKEVELDSADAGCRALNTRGDTPHPESSQAHEACEAG